MSKARLLETDLYAPVKTLLEGQGYVVKAEIGAADIVAVRDGSDPVVVELKTSFNLSLVHQAVQRQALTDHVYVAFPRGTGRPFQKALKNNKTLCRRLGLGLITVRMRDCLVEVHLDPAPYQPRQSKQKKDRLLREFHQRVGDPNTGGQTRVGLMTAYRQDALRCIKCLATSGPLKASMVAEISTVPRARSLMAANHYGWFERVERGIYALSPKGKAALKTFSADLVALDAAVDDKPSKAKK